MRSYKNFTVLFLLLWTAQALAQPSHGGPITQPPSAGGGTGDMTKAVYDTNNDGKVDAAAQNTNAAYATSTQGAKADTAVQPATLSASIATKDECSEITNCTPNAITGAQVSANETDPTVDGKITTHAGAADPHGDRAYSDGLAGNYEPAGVAVADITDASANGRSLISAADYAAMRTLLDLEAETDFNAYDANLIAWPATIDATEVGYLNGLNGNIITLLNAKAPLADSGLTGDPTVTDATPTVTLQDSDNAAGTAAINANSSGGANDVVFTLGVEDSSGEGTGYLQLDGVNEQITPLKPLAIGPLTINGTDDALSNEGYSGLVITGTAGATLAVGDVVYLSDTDGRWELADNDSTTAQANQAKGVAVLAAVADGNATTILLSGKMRLDSWAWNDNEGQPLYLSSTAGDLTETRPISASEAPQIVAYIESDDEIFVNPQPIDFSRTRIATDADGETLTCLEAQNTIWEVTAAATIVGPALSTCPTQNFTICSSVAGAVVYDPNAADDTIVDGAAGADGANWTSGSALGDCITVTQYDTDTLFGLSNGWTAE